MTSVAIAIVVGVVVLVVGALVGLYLLMQSFDRPSLASGDVGAALGGA